MKNYILNYNQINESNEFDDLSFEEVGRLVDFGLLDDDLLKIYNYVKNGSIGSLTLYNSKLTYLPKWLHRVHTLDIRRSQIKSIPSVNELNITGGILAYYTNLSEFDRHEVYGRLQISYTNIKKLPVGLIVQGYLGVNGIQFNEIPIGLRIHGNLNITNSNLRQFTDDELYAMYEIDGYISRE